MNKISNLYFTLLVIMLTTTGCWNLREPNEVATVSATGLDFTEDGRLEISVQVPVPAAFGGGADSSGGTKKKGFRVISATGMNVYDTIPSFQAQMSRNLFLGHRQVIVIGQRMAEHGITNMLDEFIRNPQTEMRSRMFIVKDGQAKDILSVEPIFEPLTSMALVHQQKTLGIKYSYFRNFLADALSQSLQPSLPAVTETDSKQFAYAGTAVFNKESGLKLVGFLNTRDSSYANWITNKQTNFPITSYVTKGDGTVSLKLDSLGRRIRAKIVGKHIHIDINLTGKGTIVENHTNLDPLKQRDLHIIQDELSKTTQTSIQQFIDRVQKQYKVDIFGFGESVHQQCPYQWKSLKHRWSSIFPTIDVSVKVKLRCQDIGQTNSAIRYFP